MKNDPAAVGGGGPRVRPPQDDLARIVEEMRAERPRYKSHDLGFVDSVAANRVDEWADELEALAAQLADLRGERDAAMVALEGLTPGGSEYVGDPAACVAYVRRVRQMQHETVVRFKGEADALRIARDRLRQHTQDVGRAMWAAIDVVKAHIGGFKNWPDALKEAFSAAIIRSSQNDQCRSPKDS